jgi:hypothetical protein
LRKRLHIRNWSETCPASKANSYKRFGRGKI